MRPSLRTRLRLGLGAIAIAVALLAVAAVISLNRLGDAIAIILRENYASVVACEEMREALDRQDSGAQFVANGRDDIGIPLLRKNRPLFARAFETEAHNITVPGEGELVREIDLRYHDYVDAVEHALTLPAPSRGEVYFRLLVPRFADLKDRIQAVERMNQDNMIEADHAAKALARRSVRAALLVGSVALLFAIWFAWWLPRVIVRPVEVLTRAAQAIGDGNLDVKVEDSPIEELKPLAEAFNQMLDRLRIYRESSLGQLLAAEDLARATLECMIDPVFVCDRAGGIRLANERAESAFGLRIGSAEELRQAGLVTPAAIANAREQVFMTGTPVLPSTLSEAMPWRTADGERYYLVRAAPLRTARRDEPSVIVIAQDVTRFHRIDELKSDMVATVSHQFKTPLTSLRMATHLLLEPTTGQLTEAQQELVTTARDDTERLRSMVEDLLDVVRIEREAGALHRVAVEPSGLLYGVIDAHRGVAREKGISLEVERAGGAVGGLATGLISVDPDRLSIALANLVSNALRHTPPGGRVALGAVWDGDRLRLHVRDWGEGIAADDLPRIFDRSEPPSAGPGGRSRHGLGLTIAREIVRQHGGEIVVESRRGEGSTFTVILPRAGDVPHPASVK